MELRITLTPVNFDQILRSPASQSYPESTVKPLKKNDPRLKPKHMTSFCDCIHHFAIHFHTLTSSETCDDIITQNDVTSIILIFSDRSHVTLLSCQVSSFFGNFRRFYAGGSLNPPQPIQTPKIAQPICTFRSILTEIFRDFQGVISTPNQYRPLK